MAKIADRYYRVDPWRIIEEGFDPARGRVSESVFSLANEYMGVRGYFEEGYSGDRLVGSYINGVYEAQVTAKPQYKGISDRFCFMVNTLDWLHTRIVLEGEKLDLAECQIEGFQRVLDLRNGTLERSFTWRTGTGRLLQVTFTRFLSMVAPKMGFQRIALKPLNFSGNVEIRMGLDFSPEHESAGANFWSCPKKGVEDGIAGNLGGTQWKSLGTTLHCTDRRGHCDPPQPGTACHKPLEGASADGSDGHPALPRFPARPEDHARCRPTRASLHEV
ncbi:MAG: hypothetical protein H5T95_06860 [Firmicutes bacterium]|nr:hypothetical protein [Bacillota bacterium]